MTNAGDQLDRDVFQHRLVGIAEEMSAALRRAAFSPIIWDMYDYSCALLTPDGEMMAQAETIPAQLGLMSIAFRHLVTEIPLTTWREGDILACNDPYRGCTHTPDIVLFSPVFHESRLIGITSTIAHHVDIGGKLPCTTAPDNLEVFAEGLTLPPLRLVEEGRPNELVQQLISANVRNPRACLGDLRAQVAGCRTGERRLKALAAKLGTARFLDLVGACLDYGERYTRRAIAAMPRGRREAEIFIEDEIDRPDPIRLKAAVEVEPDGLTVDFSGTSEQRENALNCPYASTVSMTLYAVRCMSAPDVNQNGGCSRPVTVIVPPGTVLNPRRPAAVGNRHFTQQAVADVVLRAMLDLAPERAAAGSQISFPTFRAGGFDDRADRARSGNERSYYLLHDILGGGMGASAERDGMNAVDTHGGNCALLSAEIVEMTSPVRVRRTELISGSGGVGSYRGGLAMRRDYEILAERALANVYLQQAGPSTTPWGAQGGGTGRAAGAVLNPGTPGETTLRTKEVALKLRRGDIVRLESAGGGGWGDPALRPVDLAQRDRQAGYV